MNKILTNIEIPKTMVNTPINILKDFSYIFLTINAENGTENTAPSISEGARPQSMVSDIRRYATIPVKHVKLLANEVIATAGLLFKPVRS